MLKNFFSSGFYLKKLLILHHNYSCLWTCKITKVPPRNCLANSRGILYKNLTLWHPYIIVMLTILCSKMDLLSTIVLGLLQSLLASLQMQQRIKKMLYASPLLVWMGPKTRVLMNPNMEKTLQ